MKKLLIITPHLSTGGAPQVTVNKIELLQNDFDRSICTNPANWNIPKILKLMTMFYIGDDIEILYSN